MNARRARLQMTGAGGDRFHSDGHKVTDLLRRWNCLILQAVGAPSPAEILNLGSPDLFAILRTADDELALDVRRHGDSRDVFNDYVIVGDFLVLVGPVLLAARRIRAVHLGEHHQNGNIVLEHHPPEVTLRALRRVLRQDERLGIVVSLDEGCVDVSGIVSAGNGRQNDAVPVVRNSDFVSVLRSVFVGERDARRFTIVERLRQLFKFFFHLRFGTPFLLNT